MTTPPPAVPPAGPRARVVRQRRTRPLRIGIIAAAVGLGGVVAGALLLVGRHATQVLAATDRAEVPDLLRFDAEARSYAIVLLPDAVGVPVLGDPVAALECAVERSDGTTTVVIGRRQGSSTETAFGRSVGSFTATAGATTVSCDFVGSPSTSGYFVAVAPERKALEVAGVVGLIAGLLVIAAGAWLIVIGLRGRVVLVPASAEAAEA